jgi:hypothetical protein
VAKKKGKTYQRGRDAGTGKFITVKAAKTRKKTAIVERVNRRGPKKGK